MDATPYPLKRTVEEVFNDFKGRRAGIVRALTVDRKEFYCQCHPEKENLCLYGHPNETWELNLPVDEVPPDLPEPALGINFARDGMRKMDWLSLVAVHSDYWLLSVAFYFGAQFGFGKSDRMRLFEMINDYPTVYEEVMPRAVKQVKKQAATPNNGSESKSQQMGTLPYTKKSVAMSAPKEEEDKQGSSFDKSDRMRLFGMINGYPTVYEEVVPTAVLPVKKRGATNHNNGSTNKSQKMEPVPNVVAMSAPKEEEVKQGSSFDKSDKMRLFPMINEYPTQLELFMPNAAKSQQPESVPNVIEMPYPKDEDKSEEKEDEQETTVLCGVCGEEDEEEGDEEEDFWICCDVCDGWFHGKCVKITPAEAQHIKQYKCPACRSNKWPRV